MKTPLILVLLSLGLHSFAQAPRKPASSSLQGLAPDDCSLTFAGSARKAVKLRTTSSGTHYTKINGGNPITVAQWFTKTCALDSKVPGTVPATKAMPGIETQTVKLEGFPIAAKFDPDRDLHAEIAGSPKWNTPHIVVEVPPGEPYCSARKALWDLVRQELPANSTSKIHVMNTPPKVDVTGYIFLDTAHGHTNFCHTSGGRGVKKGGQQMVRGLWEIHPVLDLVAR